MSEANVHTGTRDTTRSASSDVAADAQSKAGEVQQRAKSEVRSVASDARDQASEVLGTARRELRTQAAEQAKSLSSTLNDFSRQLGSMADGSGEPDAQVAQLARSAADSLAQRAERLDDGGIDGVVDDVKRFARNRPGAFILGSIATGFAIGRLAKHADLKQAGQRAKGELDADSSSSVNPSAHRDDPGGQRFPSGQPVGTHTPGPATSPMTAVVTDPSEVIRP